MKKMLAILLVLVMVLAMAACSKPVETPNGSNATTDTNASTATVATTGSEPDVKKVTHEEFMAAPMDTTVTVVTYVQATQSWWDNKITAYCQSQDGAFFAYEMACSEEDAAKLVPGTKIEITGVKGEWSGEVEIMDGVFKFVEGGDTFIAEAFDATALLGTDDLIKHQNEKVAFKGLTVEKIEYKNGEPGDDIYVTLSLNGASYNFCVERYLTGPETDLYKAFATLETGKTVDVEAFLYWYEGANPHITNITVQ